MLLNLRSVSKYFGERLIMGDVNLQINPRDRIGLIGRNGVGKTTLFKIITGELEPDQGGLDRLPGLTLGYLSQDIDFEPHNTLLEAMASVSPEIKTLEDKMAELERKMANADPRSEGYNRLLHQYGTYQHEYEWREGYSFHARIRTILNGMGFPMERHDDLAAVLSGGEKMRLNLARLLLKEPDLLLLDEPNNHLDLDTLEWLESYLQKWKKAMVIISHDRDFLDHVVTRIAELEECRLRLYNTNYSGYLAAKEERIRLEEKALKLQNDQVRHVRAFIERFRYKATKARQVQSREKALQKMEAVNVTRVPKKRIKVRFRMDKTSESDVLRVEGLKKTFGDKVLFTDVDFSLRKGDRVGILGPNGIGKSTLLKILVGHDDKYEGNVAWGNRVHRGYFQQDLPLVDEAHTVLDELMASVSFSEKDARDLLGLFLFSGEEVEKSVGSLSGGERNRLLLAKLVSQKANMLILDEPTNHLDIESREVLEAALSDFPGTMMVVSHDRYFLRRIVNRIFVMSSRGIAQFKGSFGEYQEHLEKLRAQEEEAIKQVDRPKEKKASVRPDEVRRQEARRKQQIGQLEETIAALEDEKALLEARMADMETYQEGQTARQTVSRYEKIQEELHTLYMEWEKQHEPDQ